MLLPSLVCPGSCSYCFGPRGEPSDPDQVGFDIQKLESLAEWAAKIGDEPLEITFHGGEPLTAGKAFFSLALPILQQARPPGLISFGVQSNLWLLDEEWLELFQAYRVGLGTSLDGPEAINDAQRGRGYFRRTMAGLNLARRAGMNAGCIATLTRTSAPHWREVLDFFDCEHIHVALHAALAVLGDTGNHSWALPGDVYGEILVKVLDFVLEQEGLKGQADRIKIEPIDSICKGVGAGKCGLCTFDDCLGKYAAVSPDGSIYSCQRFVGMEKFRLGRLGGSGPREPLEESPAWRRLEARRDAVNGECAGCEVFGLCKGGCPYNALTAGGGSFENGLRDPYCPAYRRIFREVIERGTMEFFSPENLNAVVDRPDGNQRLLRAGSILGKIEPG